MSVRHSIPIKLLAMSAVTQVEHDERELSDIQWQSAENDSA